MSRSTIVRLTLGIAGWLVLLALLRYQPWLNRYPPNNTGRERLTVGFLPVT